MKVGLFTVLFGSLPFEEMLDRIVQHGITAVELGTGNYPGNAHCDPDELLNNPAAIKAFKKALDDRGIIISGLSCHGNPLHPDTSFAKQSHDTWRKTVLLAEQMGVGVVNCFSGCPGTPGESKYPNWVIIPWPTEYSELLEWQWNEVAIPYWKEEADFARNHGVKIAIEMHPGFLVYNTDTLLRLREAAGDNIGANFDPSHLFWQGADVPTAIRYLGEHKAIYHFHAKDTFIDPYNTRRTGVLDNKSYSRIDERAWIFRTVGYGQGEKVWRDIISALRTVGYDHVLSIEHEDGMASIDEGFSKAASFLNSIILAEAPAKPWWI